MSVFPSNDDWIDWLIGGINGKMKDSYVSSCIVKLEQFIMSKQWMIDAMEYVFVNNWLFEWMKQYMTIWEELIL